MSAPRLDTPERIPVLSLALGFGPAFAILAAGLLVLAGYGWALWAGQLWAAAILIFLAGVARGLSFFTQGGPRPAQFAVMLWRFGCGLGSLLLPPVLAIPILAAGYLSVLLYDPIAARNGEAPRFFARLRPMQIALVLVGLGLLFLAAGRG